MHDSTRTRYHTLLATALGSLSPLIADPTTVEMIITPEGHVWVEYQGQPLTPTGEVWTSAQVEHLILVVAGLTGGVCTPARPHLSAVLPDSGVRLEASIPPATTAPECTLRRPAPEVYPLDAYIREGIMAPWQADVLRTAIADKANVVLAGSTGSGKTTLCNTLLALMGQERIISIEDTQELRVLSPLWTPMYTSPGVSMAALLQRALRKRPDRLVIGETRGVEALDVLDAWGTGHSGLTTIHASTPTETLTRFEACMRGVSASHPQPIPLEVARGLIARSINLIVCLARVPQGRRITALARVHGLGGDDYNLEQLSAA